MKVHFHKPKYWVRFQQQNPIRWDGFRPLGLGFPVKYILENLGDQIRVRNLTQASNTVFSIQSFPLKDMLSGSKITLEPTLGHSLQIQKLHEIGAIDHQKIKSCRVEELAQTNGQSFEDLLFQKRLKTASSGLLALMLAVFISQWMEPSLKTNEELIPQKYAKLILTKPKEKLNAPSAGGATASQAQVKAVARAFQSKTVQNSLKNILKGGISKYSIMTTGRAITSLSQKISGTTPVLGAGIQNKGSDLLAGANIGKFQMGSDNGYGSGNGVNVKGQGNGQFEIGLNTQEASVDEGLTKEEVARVIHSHMNEIRYCYEAAILKDPNLAGKLLVDFKINASGLVPHAGISEASLQGQQVTQCLLGKLKTWKFPLPRGGVIVAVSYPFIFKSLSR